YEHWNHDKRCVTMRVSKATVVESAETDSKAPGWETIFESEPCLQMGSQDFLPHLDNYESGGRLALTPQGLLLTLGDYGSDGLNDEAPLSQGTSSSYGKVWLLDLAGGHKIFTFGHRNPQGLTIDREGRIWETEQGPRGGDEL